MAITFPRAFPSGAEFEEGGLTIGLQSAQNILHSGAVQSMELGEPLWRGSFQTIPMPPKDRRRWRAWAATLKNGANSFLAYDPDHYFPAEYAEGNLPALRFDNSPFDGTATFFSVDDYLHTVTISNLPNGYKVTDGDHLSYISGSHHALHMAVEDAVASNLGVVSFAVEPHIRASVSAFPSVKIVGATCKMKLIPNSFRAPSRGWREPASFECVQTLD